jgi:hypothetical protein
MFYRALFVESWNKPAALPSAGVEAAVLLYRVVLLPFVLQSFNTLAFRLFRGCLVSTTGAFGIVFCL